MLFSFAWYPALLAIGGLAHIAVSWLIRDSAETGIVSLITGSALALLGWLVSLVNSGR